MYCFLCSPQQEGNIYENFTHALQKMTSKAVKTRESAAAFLHRLLLHLAKIIYLASNVSLLLPGSTTVTLIPLFLFFPLPVFKSESALKQNDKLGPAAFPSAALDVSVAVDHDGGWRGFAQHLADGEVDGCMWSSMKWPFWCTHFIIIIIMD